MGKILIRAVYEFIYEIDDDFIEEYESPEQYFNENLEDIREDVLENQLEEYKPEELLEFSYYGYEEN